VPVAYRLSRNFSDRFGEEIADEFVNWFNQVDTSYRSELHEQNERNWTRFDARLDQRTTDIRGDMAVLRSEFQSDLGELRTELKTDIAEVRTELKTEIGELRTELKTEIGELRTELKTEIAEFRGEFKTEIALVRTDLAIFKAELIKWMFLFWLGTVGTTLAVVSFIS
jgi:hypothetical protein